MAANAVKFKSDLLKCYESVWNFMGLDVPIWFVSNKFATLSEKKFGNHIFLGFCKEGTLECKMQFVKSITE